MSSLQALFVWVVDAHTFSHHVRLEAEVADLFSTHREAPKQVEKVPETPAKRLPLVGDIFGKKFEVVVARVREPSLPRGDKPEYRNHSWRLPRSLDADVPNPPPRA